MGFREEPRAARGSRGEAKCEVRPVEVLLAILSGIERREQRVLPLGQVMRAKRKSISGSSKRGRAARYRAQAARIRQKANSAADATERSQWIEIAEHFELLALSIAKHRKRRPAQDT